jgi:HlyD family secretion protein
MQIAAARRDGMRVNGAWLRIIAATSIAATLIFLIFVWYFVPTRVEFYRVVAAPSGLQISGPGLLDATNRVIISTKLQGRLATQPVYINRPVTKGQVLVTIDAEEIVNQLAAARADAQAAKQRVAETLRDTEIAQSVFEKTLGDLDRRKGLAGIGVVSRAELESVGATFRQAEAALARAKIGVERATAQALSADATVKALETKLADATIASPLDGVVVSRERSLGEFVQPGQPILQVVELQSIIVAARLDESLMSRLQKGQKTTVRFHSEPLLTYHGTVVDLHRLVDQETREFTVDVTLESLPQNWALGQRATVDISVERDLESMLVPIKYLSRRDGRSGLWFYRNGRARWGTVSIGYPAVEFVDITSGVKLGDVILDPFNRFEYQPVTLTDQ